MSINDDIVDTEKFDGICLLTFVKDDFSGLFLHPSVFFIKDSRPAQLINGTLSDLRH